MRFWSASLTTVIPRRRRTRSGRFLVRMWFLWENFRLTLPVRGEAEPFLGTAVGLHLGHGVNLSKLVERAASRPQLGQADPWRGRISTPKRCERRKAGSKRFEREERLLRELSRGPEARIVGQSSVLSSLTGVQPRRWSGLAWRVGLGSLERPRLSVAPAVAAGAVASPSCVPLPSRRPCRTRLARLPSFLASVLAFGLGLAPGAVATRPSARGSCSSCCPPSTWPAAMTVAKSITCLCMTRSRIVTARLRVDDLAATKLHEQADFVVPPRGSAERA